MLTLRKGVLIVAPFLLLLLPFPMNAAQTSYSFAIEGEEYVVGTLAEVAESFARHGPQYEVLTVSKETVLDEKTVLLLFTAPETAHPVGPKFSASYISSCCGDRVYIPDYFRTFDEAEAALKAAVMADGSQETRFAYSGTVGPTGRATRYWAYSHTYSPAGTLIVDSYPPPVGANKCSFYRPGQSVTYGYSSSMTVFGTESGRPCYTVGETKWYLTSFRVDRIYREEVYWCAYGFVPKWSYGPVGCVNRREVLVKKVTEVECPVEPIKPLQHWIDKYHKNDPEMAQLTKDLEAGANLSLRDLLTEATQQAESCVSAKFAASRFDYTLESTGRPKAYQAHFHDLYLRWLEHGNVLEDSPEWEACAERREQVELEMGRRIDTPAGTWDAPGGRFHQIKQAASAETSKHPNGRAFDVSGVGDVESYLAKDGPPALTVQDWVNQPTDCNIGWGGLFTKPDDVHFYLREGEQQMEFIALIAALTAGMTTELTPEMHDGDSQWARLLVSGEHIDGEVVYHYTIVNQHPDTELKGLLLGMYLEDGGAVPDLDEMPSGAEVIIEPDPQQPGLNRFREVLPESAWTAPPHWLMTFYKLETYPDYYLEFLLQGASARANVGEVPPGQQLEGFSIRLPKADPTYYETGFEARFYRPVGAYFGYPEKLDTTPPVLSVTVNRPSIWPPNNKLVDINVDIDVVDDYDGQPAINLVSITANEALAEGDIEGAEFGIDDRSFQLRASRDGTNREGRIYTITYEATDAMANVTRKSVEVIVPHDQRW